jgi:hypothetical protein
MTKKWDEEHKEQMKEYYKQYRKDHRDDKIQYNKQYRIDNKDKLKEYKKNYRDTHKKQIQERMRKYRQRPEIKKLLRKNANNFHKKTKKIVIEHYTKGKMRCELCPEDVWEIFELHHPQLDGKKHRENTNGKAGMKFYRWIIKNNFPYEITVLCPSCHAKEHLRLHKKKEVG